MVIFAIPHAVTGMLTAAMMLILTNGKSKKKSQTFPVCFCYFTVNWSEGSFGL